MRRTVGMFVNAGNARNFSISPVGLRQQAPVGGALPATMTRDMAAFAILGIDSAMVPLSGRSGPSAISGAAEDVAALAKIATDYRRNQDVARSTPDISDANARHIAQYETIVANRSSFPPEEFYIHTELGGGASVTTTIPAIGKSNESTSAPSDAIVFAARSASGVPASQLYAAYSEWN